MPLKPSRPKLDACEDRITAFSEEQLRSTLHEIRILAFNNRGPRNLRSGC